jgi:lipid II:glycine glycyltransferase (peptidoglycan interpeptide bridge formation enzyme)
MTPHYLQDDEWAEVRRSFDWQSNQVALPDQEKLRIYRRQTFLAGKVGYSPLCLPIFDKNLEANIKALSDKFSKELSFIRLEPEQLADSVDIKLLQKQGLIRPRKTKIQYQSTVEIDLKPSIEDILASFSKDTRYNIRKAEKRGVELEVIDPSSENLQRLYDFKIITSDRSGHYLRPKNFLLKFWGDLISANKAKMFEAKHEGETVAMMLITTNKDRSWNIASGSLRTKRSLAAPALMHWFVMQELKKDGVQRYDMAGISPPKIRQNKDHAMSGVDAFKTGFGQQYVRDYVGCYDLVFDRKKYDLWCKIETRYTQLYGKLTKKYWW